MVAGPAYYCAYHCRPADSAGRQLRIGAFYLYTILMQKTTRSKELETILVLVLALGLCYWNYKKNYLLLLALLIGAIGLLIPAAAKIIHWGWMKLAEGIGFVMNKVILTVIFICVVVPLGWITRKMGKSSLKLKPGQSTYFKTRDHVFTKEDMEHPW